MNEIRLETPHHSSIAPPPLSTAPPARALFDHVLLAVATGEDAERSCRVMLEMLEGQLSRVTVVTVVPRYREWADSIPSDYRLENAREALSVAHQLLYEAKLQVEAIVEQASNTSDAIHRLADRIDASAIIFSPRSANRLVDFLAGDTAWSLVKRSRRPVLVLPGR